MRTILTASDFSKNGNNTVEYAASLAEVFNSRLIICHVNETFTQNIRISESAINTELLSEMRSNLELLKQKILNKHPHLSIDCIVLTGSTSHETIKNYSEENQIDLIVIGCTGTNVIERKLMGSTSSKLILSSTIPLICIPEHTNYSPIKRIAFATDLREDNLSASHSIITFAKQFQSEISFLFIDKKDEIHTEEQISELTRKIREKVHYPKISGYIIQHINLNKGINAFHKKHNIDLLVMLKHVDENSNIALSKSNTVYVSEHTTLPLLVLRSGIISVI
ncbi:MAG: universal stress protein [Bacteroidetes bacterium]|nr:universal stress protein [Bacteroidota bacterium]